VLAPRAKRGRRHVATAARNRVPANPIANGAHGEAAAARDPADQVKLNHKDVVTAAHKPVHANPTAPGDPGAAATGRDALLGK